MKPKRKTKVIVVCKDDDLRMDLARFAAVDTVDVSVSVHHTLAELKGSTWRAGVLCMVIADDKEEERFRSLDIAEETDVLLLAPRARLHQWEDDIATGRIHSYVAIAPIQDVFDLKVRLKRVIELASLEDEIAEDRKQILSLEKKEEAMDSAHPNRGRILVIEDDIAAAELVSDILEPLGYTVKRSNSVVSACRDFELETFGAILVDLMMPGVSGSKVVEVVREKLQGRKTPIIVTTSHTDKHLIQECIDFGAADYLVKPITKAQLVPRLEAVLNK